MIKSEKKSNKYLLSGVLGFIVLLTVIAGFWESIETSFYDTWFHIRGEKDPGSDILIVAIDEKSIGVLGQLPWNRNIHAKLLAQLDKAKVVGFDILFDTYTDEVQDRSFVDAVNKHGRVILASMFTFEQSQDGNWYQQLLKPIPELCGAIGNTGFINMPAEKNIVRGVTLFDTNTYGTPYPSFGLAVLMGAWDNTAGDLKISDNILTLNNHITHIYKSNQALIDFWGPGGTFSTYSYADVLQGKIPVDVFQDKIVLIGTATPTLKGDYYDNPYTSENLVLKGSLPVPGVEIHASAIKTYMTERSFIPASDLIDYLILILVFLATIIITNKSSYLLSFPFIALFVLMISCISYFFWSQLHILMNTIAPFSMVILLFVAITTKNLVHTETERRNTRKMFSRYVSPAVVDKLLARESGDINNGVMQQVTVIFADLCDFTHFCESRTPQEVVLRLNYFFKEMTEIIFHYGGTLDKYIGDCIMAVFGAPVESQTHARDAVYAAIDMKTRLQEMNKDLISKGEEPMEVGIGINSGIVIAGSVGSNTRLEYTVIGDTVNLASRMENISKEYRAGITLGGNTVDLLGDAKIIDWGISTLGEKNIRGLSKPVKVFLLHKENDDSMEQIHS